MPRRAAPRGSAAELQGKTAATDGPVRFTASSVTFERDGLRLVAGGYQPVAAYDVLLANLDPSLRAAGRARTIPPSCSRPIRTA